MGVVYLALDVHLERDVALKIMLPSSTEERDLVRRFVLEARAVAKLKSIHIAHVYETGVTERAHPYIAMEYLDGESLGDLLLRERRIDSRIAANYGLQACVALSEAHARGIIHRDLKPSNLFKDKTHRGGTCIKLLDFGIAKSSFEAIRLTQSGQKLGTPFYMAPEQYREGTVDIRTDIWALGVILYQMVTGQVPFSGSPKELADLVATQAPPSPHKLVRTIPKVLSQTIMRCLAKDPGARYRTAPELAHALAGSDPADGQSLANEADHYARLEPTPASVMPPSIPSLDDELDDSRWTVPDGFDEDTFLQALVNRLKRKRRLIFLVGSALTAPVRGSPGVPTVEGMLQMVRSHYAGPALRNFDHHVLSSGHRRYQTAFTRLLATHGMAEVNNCIRRAVLQARTASSTSDPLLDEATCLAIERDTAGWFLAPGVKALGRILVHCCAGTRLVLTSNFDPLIEVAVASNGGRATRTVLHGDGTIAPLDDGECNVVHFHGFWRQADTLHTPTQISQPRPKLEGSLARLLREATLVVLGYGGWDDVFMQTLTRIVRSGDLVSSEEGLDVLWAFHDSNRRRLSRQAEFVLESLDEACIRGRVLSYSGVDVHRVLPRVEGALLGGRDAGRTAEVAEKEMPANLPLSSHGDTLISGSSSVADMGFDVGRHPDLVERED